MHNIAMAGQADALARMVDLSDRPRLIDLGCGPGTYSIAFCERYPNLQAVAFDHPEILPLTQERVERSAVKDRVQLQAGSLLHDRYGAGYDAALLSGVLHGLTPQHIQRVLKRAFEALNPGGLIMVQELVLAENSVGPLFAALFSLTMSSGASYRALEITEWLQAAGFREVKLRSMPESVWLDTVLTAVKP